MANQHGWPVSSNPREVPQTGPIYYYKPTGQQSGNNLLTWVIVGVVAFVGWTRYQAHQWPFNAPQPDPNHQTAPVDPETKPDTVVVPPKSLKDGWLVQVETANGRPPERQKIIDNYDFWNGLQARGLAGYRHFEPGDPTAEQFKRAAKMEPPFIMSVSKDGVVIQTIPWPTDIAAVEAMLK